MNFRECDIFESGSRRWKICRNEAGLTEKKTNEYRVKWGMSPISEEEKVEEIHKSTKTIFHEFISHGRSVSENQVAPIKYGPGSELLKIYLNEKVLISSKEEAIFNYMDEIGISGCKREFDSIYEKLYNIATDAEQYEDRKISATFIDSIKSHIQASIDLYKQVVQGRRTSRSAIAPASASASASAPAKKTKGCTGCSGKPAVAKPPNEGGWLSKQVRRLERVNSLRKAAVDFFQDGMAIATECQQQSRLNICKSCPLFKDGWCDDSMGGCGCNLSLKVKARIAQCPAQRWHKHGDNYRPLVNPVRNLIFHIYPKLGAEWNWHDHIDRIRAHQHLFNGKIAIAVVTGPNLASHQEVMDLMKDIRVTDWVLKQNTLLAETGTMIDLLKIVKTDDQNTITFRGHCKGVTHSRSGHEQPWADMMWRSCMDISSVEDALASHIMAGSFKCHYPIVQGIKSQWFYAGTFYWFRSDIFKRDWEHIRPTRWYIESWPEIVCDEQDAAVLFYDKMNRDIRWDLMPINSEFNLWKLARGIE